MTPADVLTVLERHRNERGIANWEKLGFGATGLRSYGIGLTQLRKLAKQFGRDHELAAALWSTDVYDARVVSLLIDEPKRMTREQAETQVEQLGGGMLAHVFSSCDATLAKTSFVVDLASDWVDSTDRVRRICGFGLLYEISKFSGRKAPEETFFLEQVARIDRSIDREDRAVRLAMGNALMGIGKRSARLNAAALAVADRVGPIEFDSASGECDPFDVAKHLRSDWLREKLGLQGR
jgi:3-methyladenine DNA glycosylase AlkD